MELKEQLLFQPFLVRDIAKGSFQSPKKFNVHDADKSTDVYVITE